MSLQSEFPHRILLQALDYVPSFPDDDYSFGWLHAWSLCLPSRDGKSSPSPCGSTSPHYQQYTPPVLSLSFLPLNSTSAFFLHHHFSRCGLHISLFWAHHDHVSEQQSGHAFLCLVLPFTPLLLDPCVLVELASSQLLRVRPWTSPDQPFSEFTPIIVTKTEKDTCTQMFIAALFTIARTWKHLDVHGQMNG